MSETRSVETSAADIETAIDLGLEQLGVARESVIVEILEEPSRGLLGLGARPARIRLTTAAPARQAPPVPAAPPATPSPRAPVAAAEAPSAAPAPTREAPSPDEDEEYQEYGDDEYETPSREAAYEAVQPASDEELDDDARVGMATLEELLGKMHIDAQVIAYRAEAGSDEEDAPWVLQIRGRDLGVLIGRRGETLTALQYITRLIASRDLQRRANIVLDVEGYKSRREQKLRRLAKRMADQATQLGRTVTLEPMPPYERRIVHLTLRDHPSVTTESIGEGEHRKVTIIPTTRH